VGCGRLDVSGCTSLSAIRVVGDLKASAVFRAIGALDAAGFTGRPTSIDCPRLTSVGSAFQDCPALTLACPFLVAPREGPVQRRAARVVRGRCAVTASGGATPGGAS